MPRLYDRQISMKKFLYSAKFRLILFQVILIGAVFYCCYAMITNLQANLSQQGIASGFGFLDERAGFSILWSLIDYSDQDNYLRVFWVGLTNTLLVSFLGIVSSLVLGFIIGIMRLSRNWLFSKIALVYIEVIRNIPLLLQIFFWYFVVLRLAPHPRQAYELISYIFITNRGIYIPWPVLGQTLNIGLIALVALMVARLFFINKQKLLLKKLTNGLIVVGCVVLIFMCQWDIPQFKGFNFTGGVNLIPELLSLWFALSLYTAAFIAEIIRAGIQSIPRGQWEAALSLGLSRKQTLSKIVIPQAIRVIIPPLTNQFLNLTKNSSLAAAIAYPDLVSVFAGTALNQTGQAVEIISITMAVYLLISLTISFLMVMYEKHKRY